VRHQFDKQLDPLALQLMETDPGEVTAGAGEAGDKARRNRIGVGMEDNGDRRCRQFRGPGRWGTAP